MNSSEWSLLLFTLIGQFSAGLTTAVFIFSIIDQQKEDKYYLRLLYISTVAIAIALIISFLHLSAPLASVFSLSNLKNSWLSREILMVSLYAAAVFSTTGYWQFGKNDKKLFKPLLFLSAIIGLAMVLTMGKLYMVETIPVWNTPSTLIAFYVNTFLLGSSFLLLYLKNAFNKTIHHRTERFFLLIITSVLALKFITGLVNWGTEINDSIGFGSRDISSFWHGISWVWLLGLGILIRKIYPQPMDKKISKYVYHWAFVFFVLAEFAARFIFYSSYFRVGI
jgi:DMSO reductase anchor subunit